jgi:nicotinamidase-related amidase
MPHACEVDRLRLHAVRAPLKRTRDRPQCRGTSVAKVTYDRELTALLVIDPYNDFISEGGKVWDRLKAIAEANACVPHMAQVLNAARQARLRVFYALHRQYRPGDYDSWKSIAPVQEAARSRKTFEHGTWGGELRSEFVPQPGDVVALEHWGPAVSPTPIWTCSSRDVASTSSS